MDRISVVLTTYNRKYELRRALESVLEQSIKPYEIIIIDDASTDGTKSYIDSFQFENIKYVLLNTRSGVGIARNYGIRLAEGEFIAFLDSDNEWYPTKLEEFTEFIKKNDIKWDLICSKYKKHIYFSTVIFPEKLTEVNIRGEQEIWLHNIADASASIYRKSFLEEIGGFSEELTGNIDWELLLRGESRRELSIKKIDKILSENWTMYDSLSNLENVETALREKLDLFHDYHKEILLHNCGDVYYLQYLNDVSGKMSETEAVYRLLESCDNSLEWLEIVISYYKNLELNKANILSKKSSFYQVLYNWLCAELYGKSLSQKLENLNIQTVAIYGAGRHGKLLYQDIRRGCIQIRYFIDCKGNDIDIDGIIVYKPDEYLPAVDAVIVSTYLEFDSIKDTLKIKGDPKIIALDDLLDKM